MNWKPRASWAVLSLLTALAAWALTRWVTHVNTGSNAVLTLTYNEEGPARHLDLTRLSLTDLQRDRYRIPGVVIASTTQALLIVTPATRAISFGISPGGVTCGYDNRVMKGAALISVVEMPARERLKPLLVVPYSGGGSTVAVPAALRAALAKAGSAQGMIACEFLRPIAGKPTFTDRSLTLRVQGLSGVFMLDVSALEDIDNLRFSGGVAFPLAGERIRFLDGTDNIVSVEWVNVAAEEQRDIILVTVGALAAIAAAMAIEAIRPFIEQ